jgi:hypothetical protein
VFDWVFEGHWAVFSVLAMLALMVLLLWWWTHRRFWLIGCAVLAGLIGLYALLNVLVETDREQIKRKLDDMAAAVQPHDTDRIFRHISPEFRYQNQDRAAFRSYVEYVFRHNWVDRLTIWNYEWPEGGNRTLCPVNFNVKLYGQVSGEEYYLVRALFSRDPDYQWRLRHFEVFNPFVQTTEPLRPPGLP